MGSSRKNGDKYRSLSGLSRNVSVVLLSGMPVLLIVYILDIHTYIGLAFYKEQYLGIFLSMFLASTFINLPASKACPRDRVPWYDALSAVLCFVIFGNVALLYPELVIRLGFADMSQVIMGLVAIVLVFEAVRRIIGYPLVIIGLAMILYARFAYVFPGLLNARGVSWRRLFFLHLSGSK